MYDVTAQQILLDKLGYEVWLLDFLAKRQDMFEGGTDISRIEITSNKSEAKINVGITEHLGAGAAQSIMDAMAPLNAVSLAAWLIVQIKTFSFGTVFSRILSARPYTFCALDKYCPDLFNIRKQQIVCTIEQ